jgi:SAM-dependent methyltransferase
VTAPVLAAAQRRAIAGAYSATGHAWRDGPARIYAVLAREQLAAAGTPLAGARVLDLGAGTGVAGDAALAAGAAAVVALDAAHGMLAVDREHRPPGVVGDALALPFASGSFDVVVAAFSLNHVDVPVQALGEAARVIRDGGRVLASTYAGDDGHPAKQAVEAAAARWGWRPEPWHDWVRTDAIPRLATVELAREAALAAGLVDVDVVARRIAFPELGPRELVEWRLGMAQYAEFIDRLEPAARHELAAAAVEELGDAATLVRSVLFVSGRVVNRTG